MTSTHTTLDWPQQTGAEVLAIDFDDELKAREALLAATRLGKGKAIGLADAAIVTNGPNGRRRILQTKDTNPGQGAARYGWLAGLAGLMIAGTPGLLIGGLAGAIGGWLWARYRDIGINDDWMKRATGDLAPGHAVAFFQMDFAYPTNLLRELRRFDGRLIHNSIRGVDSDQLQDALGYVP